MTLLTNVTDIIRVELKTSFSSCSQENNQFFFISLPASSTTEISRLHSRDLNMRSSWSCFADSGKDQIHAIVDITAKLTKPDCKRRLDQKAIACWAFTGTVGQQGIKKLFGQVRRCRYYYYQNSNKCTKEDNIVIIKDI